MAENSIRPFVLGRKNWLFSGTPEGAKASAQLYSLIETAKTNNSLEELEALLPWNISQEQMNVTA